MDRRNQLLTAVLLLQVVLAAFIFWPSSTSNAAVGALVTGIKASEVTDLKIQDDKKTLHVAKVGDKWVLPDNGAFPVNEVQVSDFISKVLKIDTGRLVANTTASHTRLKVDDKDFVRRVDLTAGNGKTQTILIGTSPNVRATNVRTASNNAVYLTDGVTGSDINVDTASWINAAYFTAAPTDIKALSFANAKGKFDFTKTITGTWTLAGLAKGEQFSENNFSTRLSGLNSLQMTEPLGKQAKPEYGLDKPSATITITIQPSGTTPTKTILTVGAKDASSNSYVVKSSAAEYYVRVATFSLDTFVNDDRSQFLVTPPPPAPSLPPVATPNAKP